ncbi:hypothetical protein CRUP_037248 [Coryphaenoides rupestris]|nr:hypothetical protein CRUP_037248 [Coryphaenoides rupestris]
MRKHGRDGSSTLIQSRQGQVTRTFEKHGAVQHMIQSRQACLRKLADKHVRPVQLVIEVMHDYQEHRSCVSYSLDGDESPELLQRPPAA